MKNVKRIASIAMAGTIMGVSLLSGSGCFLEAWIEAKIPAPESIEINGVTYVTGFYREDTSTGSPKRENKSTPDYKEGLYEFWKLSNTQFELYGSKHEDALDWAQPTIYCKESEVEAVKAYYENPENCIYYLHNGAYEQSRVEITEPVNTAYLENAIEYAYKLAEDWTYNPFEGKGLTELKAYGSELTASHSVYTVYIRKYSKDEIFKSPYKSEYKYIDGKLYAHKPMKLSLGEAIDKVTNDKEIEQTYYLLEGEEYDYIVELFEKYMLESKEN